MTDGAIPADKFKSAFWRHVTNQSAFSAGRLRGLRHHRAALGVWRNNVTMPNRHALESGRSMMFRCHRRGRYIV